MLASFISSVSSADCPAYSDHSRKMHEPLSTGGYRLSYMRPSPECRTFNSSVVEKAMVDLKEHIADPDLYRLFENTFPNTLDTAIKWHGVAANNSDEELTFVVTGDIDAMWIRDSANQIAPYKMVMTKKSDDIASVFRGTINMQARYMNQFPYCNAFQPPEEAPIAINYNGGRYKVTPSYDKSVVFTCNFELDDWGGFLQLSHDYYESTQDLEFFGKFQWIPAVQSIMASIEEMRQPTYGPDGEWQVPVYTFQSATMSAFGTLGNNGFMNPVNYTGMARSPFRPSDDTVSTLTGNTFETNTDSFASNFRLCSTLESQRT